jgi:hypothetical protein
VKNIYRRREKEELCVRVPTGDVSLGGGVQANGSSGDGSLGNGEHILSFLRVGVLDFFFVCRPSSEGKTLSEKTFRV